MKHMLGSFRVCLLFAIVVVGNFFPQVYAAGLDGGNSALVGAADTASRNDESTVELHLGGDSAYPPFEYLDARGQPAGFNVDLTNALAKAMGLKVKIDLGPWDKEVLQLERGKVDALMGMFKTEERDKKFDFSVPYFIGSYAVFVRKGSAIQSIDDVKDKVIVVQLGDLGHDYVKENGLGKTIITKGDWTETLKALAAGEGDCAIVSRFQSARLIRELSLDNLQAVGPPLIQRKYGFAVREGDTALLSKLNEGLSIIKSNGDYDAIYKKWFAVYEEQTFADVFRYFLWIVLPLLGVTAGAFVWTWLLKKQVGLRTAELSKELQERKQAEAKLLLAASVYRHAREGIMITNAAGEIIDVNDAFSAITGYSRDEVLGKNPKILGSGRHDWNFYAILWRSLIEKGHWYGEVWNKRKNGEVYAVLQTISTVTDELDHSTKYVALFSDISLLKENERQLETLAHYDVLTTLPNRVLFADRLNQAMVQAQRRRDLLAVIYLDLDGFKAINDRYGHPVGDQLLFALAGRMKQTLREGDTIARIGGDEFVAVLPGLTDVSDSVWMLTRLLAAAAQPIHVGDLSLQVSASLGVTFYAQTEDIDADQLLRQADQSMYQAKLSGKNRYHVFDAEQDRSVRGHHESLDNIRLALIEGQFVLYYQPKVNMRTGKVVGAEALIRWQHPERGVLPPGMFLPLIEDNPLAIKIGEWVINSALAQLSLWQAEGLDIPISVNLGARQLLQANFVERLREFLNAHPTLTPGRLEMEVLETSALEDLTLVARIIEDCRSLGVRFALDDFGTGYSSLTYLKRLSVAQLKIDQSFVRDMLVDPDDLAILEGVLGLATAFRREVIAEGVETIEQGEMLLCLGCDFAQGYVIARPMPAADFPAWVKVWRPDPVWDKQHSLSREDFPLLFAGVEGRAWIAAVEKSVNDGLASDSSLDMQNSRLKQWLSGVGKARFGSARAFIAIKALHEQILALLSELQGRQNQGLKLEAQAMLPRLRKLMDELLEQVKVLVYFAQNSA